MSRAIGVTASASLGLQQRGRARGRGRGDPMGACAAPGAGEGLAAAGGSYLVLHGGCQPNPPILAAGRAASGRWGGTCSPRMAPPSQPAVHEGWFIQTKAMGCGGKPWETPEGSQGCCAAERSLASPGITQAVAGLGELFPASKWRVPAACCAHQGVQRGSWPCSLLGWDNPAGRQVLKTTRNIAWKAVSWRGEQRREGSWRV